MKQSEDIPSARGGAASVRQPETAVTVGTFDGLHRGHRAVLTTLNAEASRHALRPLVMTFSNHPLDVIAPDRAPGLLMSPEDKRRELERSGAEVVMQRFTHEMMGLTAREWMCHLRDDFHARLIVIGYDNTFGCDGRELSTDDYRALGRELGLEVVVAPIVENCSSSAIRRAVTAGDMELAGEMLGHPYTLTGTIVEGDRIGRTIGFPTANLQLSGPMPPLLPPRGVYVSLATLADGRRFGAVTNIGVRPSVASEPQLRIETHILGLDEDLYGRPLSIGLLTMLRKEQRFPSLDHLKKAISSDISRALSYLRAINLP